MSKYGYSVYGASKYGITPKLAYSVEPMGINVIKFHEVYVNWQSPSGTFTRFRLVRNQNGYPETAEDGLIVFEQDSTDGLSLEGKLTRNTFLDGEENPSQIPITPGRNIFYRIFLYTSDNIWVKAGDISDVVPSDTGAMKKTIDLLPRVLTTPELSPLGVVDEASDLYKFLDGIAFTYEQWLTQIKLTRPAHNLETSNYRTIPGEVLTLGLTPEPNLPMLRQRALIREAIPLYADKGTALGVSNYAESLTGFAPTLTVSPNLMLTVQDSTFYKSTGRWVSTNAVISYTDEMIPDNSEKSIDLVYTLKIEPITTGNISLGADAPITQGVPISASTEYTYRVNTKCPASGGMTLDIAYYSKDNALVGTSSQAISATNSWQTLSITETSPVDASYVAMFIGWDTVTDYYIDMVYVGATPFVEYEEARAVTISLYPKLENYIENPSFEIDSSGWSLSGITFSQDSSIPSEGYPGSYSGNFVASGSWILSCDSKLEIEPGIYFNVSHYMKSLDMASMTSYIELYDSTDTLIDTVSNTHTLTDSWMRGYTSILIPSSSTAAYAKYRLEGTAGTLYLDMVMAEDTLTPTDYFDGSMPALIGAIWESTPHQSYSLYYPNKSIKFLRLAQTLTDWMPMNSWWRLVTPAGLEYTNLDV